MNPQNTFYRIGGLKGSRFSHPQATMVPAKKNDLFDKQCPKKTLDTALGVFWYCQIEHFYYHMPNMSQPAFTCLKSTIETLEQCMKSVQS